MILASDRSVEILAKLDYFVPPARFQETPGTAGEEERLQTSCRVS